MAKIEEIYMEERADIEQLDIGTAFKDGKNYYIKLAERDEMICCLNLNTMKVTELNGRKEVTLCDIVKIMVRQR